MIRSWIRNLATPPLDSEALVIDAIVDGRCGAGLVSRSAARQAGLAVSIPMPASATVEAAGIARHARNPDAAKRLVEWLTGEDAQRSHSERRGHFAANRQAAAQALPEIRHPAAAGAFDEDAVKLAERAAWH
jgi:iron(III) transport system substrate-binding protein